MTDRRYTDALEVPNAEFVAGAKKRATQHSKTKADFQTVISYRLSRDTHKRLKLAAVNHEKTQADILDQAINEYLDKLDNESRINEDDEDGI